MCFVCVCVFVFNYCMLHPQVLMYQWQQQISIAGRLFAFVHGCVCVCVCGHVCVCVCDVVLNTSTINLTHFSVHVTLVMLFP